ncbi:hypothetical protein Tco_0969573 [Tanacetum coccineum]
MTQPEDIQELLNKLLQDLQSINEELAEYINSPSWNRPAFYDDDDDDDDDEESLLNRDTPIVYSPNIDSLLEEFAGELAPILSGIHEADFDPEEDIRLDNQLFYDDTSSDGDSFEDIDYVEASPPDSKLVSLENSFIFDLSINPFPPVDRSDFYHEEFADELAHIISPPDLECFYFKIEPDLGDLIDPGIRENVSSTTNVNLPFEDVQSPLLAFVVWIFLAFLTYPVTLPYLLSCGNEDTIFNPGIPIYHSFMPGYPDFEGSRAHGFVHSFELHILSFI